MLIKVTFYLEEVVKANIGLSCQTKGLHCGIARAKGMSQVARDTGLSRESLYKALSGDRILTFDTVLKVIGALGLTLRAEPITKLK